MSNSMDKDERKFGLVQPLGSDFGREVKAADWPYTYLRAFYEDESRPYGVITGFIPTSACPTCSWSCKAGRLR